MSPAKVDEIMHRLDGLKTQFRGLEGTLTHKFVKNFENRLTDLQQIIDGLTRKVEDSLGNERTKATSVGQPQIVQGTPPGSVPKVEVVTQFNVWLCCPTINEMLGWWFINSDDKLFSFFFTSSSRLCLYGVVFAEKRCDE